MPIYTYRCAACGVQFEHYQTFSEDPLVKCPECGKKSLRKVFTPTGIIFKGSGWYSTDHKSPSGSSARTEKKADVPAAPDATEKPAADKPAGDSTPPAEKK
jgi:putative FmdB family regulatory protein